MMFPVLREICYSKQYEKELSEFDSDVKRTDEFMRGAVWTLSRNPEHGTRIAKNSRVWFLPIEDTPTATPVAVYYTFNENKVLFLSIKKVSAE